MRRRVGAAGARLRRWGAHRSSRAKVIPRSTTERRWKSWRAGGLAFRSSHIAEQAAPVMLWESPNKLV